MEAKQLKILVYVYCIIQQYAWEYVSNVLYVHISIPFLAHMKRVPGG